MVSQPCFSLLFFVKITYNFYLDIMFSGGIRRGLHIDDDDDPKPVYEHQGLEADRKRGKFEMDLDAMLFGGGPAPSRRRPASENKPTQQGKPYDLSKPVETQKPQTNVSGGSSKPSSSTSPPAPQSSATDSSNKPVIKITESTTINTVKAPQSEKGKITNQASNSSDNTINISPNGPKVIVKESSKQIDTNNKKQPSILVPSSESDKPTVINSIPIESQPILPEKKGQKTTDKKTQPLPSVPSESYVPEKEEIITIQVLHPFSVKQLFNKPGTFRKGKKVADDFKFAQENVVLTNSVDVVRPFQTDRARQRKHNDFDFKDYEFPSTSFSLGGEHKAKASVWKKQKEIAKSFSFGKYVDPNDVHPGILSSPHFASTVSAIAENEANTKRLIQDQKANGNGFYLIRLYINSVWRYVIVDSSLPFVDGEHAGIVSSPDSEFQLSQALIEKAYAKSFGGYHVFSRVQPREHYLRDLTGAPVKKYSIQDPNFGAIIKKKLAAEQIVLAVPNQKIASIGLNPNFSYPVLNYSAKGSLELRNSFGTLEQKSKVSIKSEGNFELGAGQAKDFISHILVSSLNRSYFTSILQSRHRHGFYSSYNFRIRKETQGYLSVNQWDERLFPLNSGYEYSPVHIVLHRVEEEDDHAVFISAAFTSAKRNLDLKVNLTPGNYTIFVNVNWKKTEYPYNLTFYASERVDFERVHTETLPNLISQSLEEINLREGRRTQINKNSAQYLYYHQASNLVILTVENNSEKDATVTADLSKIKFDHLVLLTSHNNEENYSNKVGAEIDQYKQIPLTDKRWSVRLQGGHRFTWVLASDQPYSEDSLRSWGFS